MDPQTMEIVYRVIDDTKQQIDLRSDPKEQEDSLLILKRKLQEMENESLFATAQDYENPFQEAFEKM